MDSVASSAASSSPHPNANIVWSPRKPADRTIQRMQERNGEIRRCVDVLHTEVAAAEEEWEALEKEQATDDEDAATFLAHLEAYRLRHPASQRSIPATLPGVAPSLVNPSPTHALPAAISLAQQQQQHQGMGSASSVISGTSTQGVGGRFAQEECFDEPSVRNGFARADLRVLEGFPDADAEASAKCSTTTPGLPHNVSKAKKQRAKKEKFLYAADVQLARETSTYFS